MNRNSRARSSSVGLGEAPSSAAAVQIANTLLLQQQESNKLLLSHPNLALVQALLDRLSVLPDYSKDLQKRLYLSRDAESGSTALHRAILRGNIAQVLFLLRSAMEHHRQQKLYQRPMNILRQDTNLRALLKSIVTQKDAEGLTPGELLARLQIPGLQRIRDALASWQKKPIALQRGRSLSQASQTNAFLEEQDETPDSFRFLKTHGALLIEEDESENSATQPLHSSFQCDIITFGQAQPSTTETCMGRPQRVTLPSKPVAIAGATHHTLCVTQEGHVYVWGLDKHGRLGLGSNAASHCAVPTKIPMLARVRQVAAADHHSVAVTFNGHIYTWGSNRFGQLGIADPSWKATPQRLEALKNVSCTAVAAGEKHSVALTSQGEVYVWGDNSSGQLGTNRQRSSAPPQRVEALKEKVVISLAAADYSTLVLVAPAPSRPVHSIYTWGHGHAVPTRVVFETLSSRPVDPIHIACAKFHNVALTSDGSVYSWGLHAESLGNKANKSPVLASPQLVSLPEPAVAVSASEHHTAVVTDRGALYTWGATHGANIMGHEGVRWQPDPKRVPGVVRAVGVAAAKEHTALLIGGVVPPLPSSRVDTLEDLAAREVCRHLDLFNVLPVLIMAERTQSKLLIDYCEEYIRQNLDGVLNLGQRSVMDCYLDEQLLDSVVESDTERDGEYHPLFMDFVAAGNVDGITSSVEEWLMSCEKLARTSVVAKLVQLYSRKNLTMQQNKLNGSQGVHDYCSERCLSLTTNMDLSTKELAQTKLATLNKEVRGVKKKLSQIAKLKESCVVSPLTIEQQEKLGRRAQLEADLSVIEPALKTVQSRLKEITLSENTCVKSHPNIMVTDEKVDNKCDFVKVKESKNDSEAEEKDSLMPSAYRCETCNITCTDENNFTLHLNGRKHRNKVAQLEEEEEKKAALGMMKDRQRNEILKPNVRPKIEPVTSVAAKSPWKDMNALHTGLPKFKLPPPPHPTPDTIAQNDRKKSLLEIIEDEVKIRASAPCGDTSTPQKTLGKLQLPPGSAPQLKSPPWASARSISTDGRDPLLLTQPPASPAVKIESTPKTYSLGEFFEIPSLPAKPSTCSPKWASPIAMPAASMNLRDIQRQEEALKQKQDQSIATNGKWFVERRERAGSFKEIQSSAEKEREERRLIAEQFEIERQIQEDLVSKTAKEGDRESKGRAKGKRGKSAGKKKVPLGSNDSISEKCKVKTEFKRSSPAGHDVVAERVTSI